MRKDDYKNNGLADVWEHLTGFPKLVTKGWDSFPDGMEILVSRRIPSEKESSDDVIKVSSYSPQAAGGLSRFRISQTVTSRDEAFRTLDAVLKEYEKRSSEISLSPDRERSAADMAYLSLGALFMYRDGSLVRAEASMTPKSEKALEALRAATAEMDSALQKALRGRKRLFPMKKQERIEIPETGKSNTLKR